MKRVYPKDIEDVVAANIKREVEEWMKDFDRQNPNAPYSRRYSEEYAAKDLIRWYNELPKTMSDDEIREYLGIPVKSQEDIEKEILATPHKTGFSVAETTGLDLISRGTYYEVVLPS